MNRKPANAVLVSIFILVFPCLISLVFGGCNMFDWFHIPDKGGMINPEYSELDVDSMTYFSWNRTSSNIGGGFSFCAKQKDDKYIFSADFYPEKTQKHCVIENTAISSDDWQRLVSLVRLADFQPYTEPNDSDMTALDADEDYFNIAVGEKLSSRYEISDKNVSDEIYNLFAEFADNYNKSK